MSKNKRNKNKQQEPIKEEKVEVVEPVVEQEEPVVENTTPVQTQLHMTTLISRYLNSELSEKTYGLLHINKASPNAPFEILLSRDESSISKSLPACYLIKANPKYTKSKYCVILNAHVHSSMAAIDQNFIEPFITSLHESLLPDSAFENGVCKFDLTLPIDRLACFVNGCLDNPILKGKVINYNNIYNNLMGFFTNYLPKGYSSDNSLIHVVTEEDVFE